MYLASGIVNKRVYLKLNLKKKYSYAKVFIDGELIKSGEYSLNNSSCYANSFDDWSSGSYRFPVENGSHKMDFILTDDDGNNDTGVPSIPFYINDSFDCVYIDDTRGQLGECNPDTFFARQTGYRKESEVPHTQPQNGSVKTAPVYQAPPVRQNSSNQLYYQPAAPKKTSAAKVVFLTLFFIVLGALAIVGTASLIFIPNWFGQVTDGVVNFEISNLFGSEEITPYQHSGTTSRDIDTDYALSFLNGNWYCQMNDREFLSITVNGSQITTSNYYCDKTGPDGTDDVNNRIVFNDTIYEITGGGTRSGEFSIEKVGDYDFSLTISYPADAQYGEASESNMVIRIQPEATDSLTEISSNGSLTNYIYHRGDLESFR